MRPGTRGRATDRSTTRRHEPARHIRAHARLAARGGVRRCALAGGLRRSSTEICASTGQACIVIGDGVSTQDDIDIFFARVCFRGQRHSSHANANVLRGSITPIDERLPRLQAFCRTARSSHVASVLTEEEKEVLAGLQRAAVAAGTFDDAHCTRASTGRAGSRVVWTSANPVGRRGLVARRGSRWWDAFCRICASLSRVRQSPRREREPSVRLARRPSRQQ